LVDFFTAVEIFFAGFFGMVCFVAPRRLRTRILSLPGRIDRLRRSRWQLLAIIAVMLVLRIQHELPPAIELTVALLFVVLLAFPVRQLVKARD
jgi:hypothetical protein